MKKKVHTIISRNKFFYTICIYVIIFILVGCDNGKKFKSAASILEAKESGNFIKEYTIIDCDENLPFTVEEAWIGKVWRHRNKIADDSFLYVYMKLQLDSILLNNDQLFKYNLVIEDSLTKRKLEEVPYASLNGNYAKKNEIQWKFGWRLKGKDIKTLPPKLQFNVIYDENRDSLIGKITLFFWDSSTDL